MADETGGGGKRALTVIAYLCADTGSVLPSLERDIEGDLQEMVNAGGSQSMAICVQMDRDSTGVAKRYVISEGPSMSTLEVPIGGVNMGDPDSLMAFLDWAMLTRPAERYALIVGSHGSGPKADAIYGTRIVRAAVGAKPRAIAFDDRSRSFLSMPELRRCLEHGVAVAGKPFLVIVCDACYMATWETVLELRGLTEAVVASTEAVPGAGMPYEALLNSWRQRVESMLWAWLGPRNLAATAVLSFQAAYRDTPDGTTASLSAIDMSRLDDMAGAMDRLGTALLEAACARPMIGAAIDQAMRASDPDFVELASLTDQWANDHGIPAPVRTAASDVWETICRGHGRHGAFVSYTWAGKEATHGAATFLPRGSLPAWYGDLAVSKTPWGKWALQFRG